MWFGENHPLDVDHYNLLCQLEDAYLSKIKVVFFPRQRYSKTAKYISERLKRICKSYVCISPQPRHPNTIGIRELGRDSQYILYIGMTSSDKNKSGLLLTALTNRSVVLLTGDHNSRQVWGQQYDDTEYHTKSVYVVVPHHGGNVGNHPIACSKPRSAVISTGKNNYGHPKSNVIDDYLDVGFNVWNTDEVGNDVDLFVP